MKIVFSGFEHACNVIEKGITVLQISRERLFARICESLHSLEGESAVEPYTVWNEQGIQVSPQSEMIVITNPFSLPWTHKDLMPKLYSLLERELLFDEGLRKEFEVCHSETASLVSKLGFQFNADYAFGIEWSLKSYLKAFSYEIDLLESSTLLDRLINLIELGADTSLDKKFVFFNLKTFLSKNDLLALHERSFFYGIGLLLIENHESAIYDDIESKYIVDRDFLEYIVDGSSECTSSSQGGLCPNVLEQWHSDW